MRPILLAALLLWGSLILPAKAASPPTGPELGPGAAEVHFYFDRISHTRNLAVEVGVPFDAYVVATNVEGGLRGWEMQVIVPKPLRLLAHELEGLSVLDAASGEFMVGLGPEDCRGEDEILLAKLTLILEEEADDLMVRISGLARSSFDPPSPGFLRCDGIPRLTTMAHSDTMLVVNPAAFSLPEDRPAALQDLLKPLKTP